MVAQEETTTMGTSQVEESSVRTSSSSMTDDSLRSSRSLMMDNNNNNDNNKRANSVSFHSAPNEIHEIPSARNLSRRQKVERWITNEEFQAAKDACTRELYRLDMAEKGFDIVRFRGLELLDPGTSIDRQKRSMQAVAAVKREQQYQRRQGISDGGEGIKKAYRQISSQQMKEAVENAYIDTMAVKEYLADTMLELEAEYKARKEKEAKKKSCSGGGGGGIGLKSLRRSLMASLSPKKIIGSLKALHISPSTSPPNSCFVPATVA
jgi:hypothetical protein